MNEHEQAMVKAFFKPTKRERYRGLLQSLRGRAKLIRELDHLGDLDTRYMVPIAPCDQSAKSICELLVQRGAPEHCYIISSNPDIDGHEMRLHDALRAVVGHGHGTLISCIPEKCGYYEGEDMECRWILSRE
ncbi:MAG: hypothetical protein H6815_12505 [Phycisphaeraceae bacterium]|nr:hypothetical protein [Phycisphaerales bacterium]MCB9861262.1 hypothetical protein [Phycisphaeraceae bacterium]